MFKRHFIKELSAYCNGELPAEVARRVREHLLACGRCRKEHDEIKLGVQLAQQLPLVTAPAEMWSEIEALLDGASRQRVLQLKSPKFAFGFSWYQFAAVSAMLVVAVVFGVIWFNRPAPKVTPQVAWQVENRSGNVRIDDRRIGNVGSLAVGGTLETENSSKANLKVGEIGDVELEANTRLTLVEAQPTEHRLALTQGKISATISAPPRLFIVDIPAGKAIDLGCKYTLSVDDAGASLLHVTLGFVALVRDGREVWVPRYAMCQARLGIGPGTPYFEDASDALVSALEKYDFENGGDEAFRAVLKESRARDTFTLWQLLSRVDSAHRVQVLDRMIELVGLPRGITREGTLQLDQNTLEGWKDEMDTIWF
jgi:hypothetical protein